MPSVNLMPITDRDSKDAPVWLRTALTKQRRSKALATSDYHCRLQRTQHRYRSRRRRSENRFLGEPTNETLPRAATDCAVRSRREYIPIQTLVSDKESFLQKRVLVSLAYLARPKRSTPMFGNAAIAAGQTYHIRTKLVLIVDTDVVAIVVPRRYK